MNVKERRVRKKRIAFIDILARSSYSFISISCIFYVYSRSYCYCESSLLLLSSLLLPAELLLLAQTLTTHAHKYSCVCVCVRNHMRVFLGETIKVKCDSREGEKTLNEFMFLFILNMLRLTCAVRIVFESAIQPHHFYPTFTACLLIT